MDVNTQMKMLQQGWHLFGIRRFFDDQPKSPTETPPEKQNVYGEGNTSAEMKNLDTLCSAAVAAAEASTENATGAATALGTTKRSHAETEDDYDEVEGEEATVENIQRETDEHDANAAVQLDENETECHYESDEEDNDEIVAATGDNNKDQLEELLDDNEANCTAAAAGEEEDDEEEDDEEEDEEDDDEDDDDDDIEEINTDQKLSEKETKRLEAAFARKVAKNEKRIDAYMQKLVEGDEMSSPSKSRRLSHRLENLILSNVTLKPEDLCDPDLVRVFPQISNFKNSSGTLQQQFVEQQQQKQLQAAAAGSNEGGFGIENVFKLFFLLIRLVILEVYF